MNEFGRNQLAAIEVFEGHRGIPSELTFDKDGIAVVASARLEEVWAASVLSRGAVVRAMVNEQSCAFLRLASAEWEPALFGGGPLDLDNVLARSLAARTAVWTGGGGFELESDGRYSQVLMRSGIAPRGGKTTSIERVSDDGHAVISSLGSSGFFLLMLRPSHAGSHFVSLEWSYADGSRTFENVRFQPL